MAVLRSSALCLCLLIAFAAGHQLRASSKKQGCGHGQWLDKRSRIRRSSSRVEAKPGAGLGSITPFQESFNDGFSMVGCLKDDMLLHGDKNGDGKFSYKMGPITNVSIVHYTDIVPGEDQEQMTHEICFGLCRTVPDMHFFGITNGRDCYCTPYYRQIASDSSSCDAVCDGNPTTMCGGKTKSSIFEMHACNDAQGKLAAAGQEADVAKTKLGAVAGEVLEKAVQMQTTAANLQPELGKVGDSAATGHLQMAKVFAGKLGHTAQAGLKLMRDLEAMKEKAMSGGFGPMTTFLAEKITADMTALVTKANAASEELAELQKQAVPPRGPDSAELYYPVMYFVDKDYKDAPSTCGGKSLGQPIVSGYSGCAGACEAAAGKCKGFSYMEGGLCFLLSEVSSATYYTGCDKAEEPPKSAAFLQKAQENDDYAEAKSDEYSYDYYSITDYEGAEPEWMPEEGESFESDYDAPAKVDNYDYSEAPEAPPAEEPIMDDYSEAPEAPEAPTSAPAPAPTSAPAPAKVDNYDYSEGYEPPHEEEGSPAEEQGAVTDEHSFSCVVKFADFEGVTLKPDPSGKCDGCLKKATKADRCIAK